MKLNFWQWLGVVLLLVAALVYFLWDRPRRQKRNAPATGTLAPLVVPVAA